MLRQSAAVHAEEFQAKIVHIEEAKSHFQKDLQLRREFVFCLNPESKNKIGIKPEFVQDPKK